MIRLGTVISVVSALLAISQPCHAEKLLGGDEIKALITGKTVYASMGGNGEWRQFFAPDGTSARDTGETSDWSVEGDKHCNSGVNLRCAAIRDNGDGTYARLKPNGSPAVTWTKIVNGKDF